MKTIKENFSILLMMSLVVGLLLTGCDVNDNEGSGTMRVALTDAPGDYSAVNIEIHQVLVKKSDEEGDENAETENMDDKELEESGWKVIFNDTLIVNLLDYQNGKTLPLGEVELEAGRYEQIRLVLGDENTVTLTEGGTFDLKTPSGQTSGYKLIVNADIEEGEVYDLVIDFDAHRSIVARGNGEFNLKPVLRTVELDNTGSISGVITPVEANPYIYTVADGDTIGTVADADGKFTIMGLYQGTYNITFDVDDESYADSTITGIELNSNEDLILEDTVRIEVKTLIF